MWNGHPSRSSRVLQLNVTAFLGDLVPTRRFQSGHDVPALHVCIDTHSLQSVQQKRYRAVPVIAYVTLLQAGAAVRPSSPQCRPCPRPRALPRCPPRRRPVPAGYAPWGVSVGATGAARAGLRRGAAGARSAAYCTCQPAPSAPCFGTVPRRRSRRPTNLASAPYRRTILRTGPRW